MRAQGRDGRGVSARGTGPWRTLSKFNSAARCCELRALERLDAPARQLEMPPPFALLARFQDEQPVLVVADYQEGAEPTPDPLPR
jgi:hypothetical protein